MPEFPMVYHDGDPSMNLDALLARRDLSAVIVALPITLQPEIIIKAFEAGKHVLSEKPVAPDIKQGIHLIETYHKRFQRSGLIWRVAENFEAEPVPYLHSILPSVPYNLTRYSKPPKPLYMKARSARSNFSRHQWSTISMKLPSGITHHGEPYRRWAL